MFLTGKFNIMGFFSNLTGQKLIGTAKICFYGEDKASVEYKTDVSDQEQREADLMQLFALYYSKILFNLNKGEIADGLILYMQKANAKIINASEDNIMRENILSTGQELVETKVNDATKKYQGELFEKANGMRIVQTHMDMVGEGYYAPTSVIMFFQYLIKNLSENHLRFLLFVLAGINGYYSEIGDYSNIKSLSEAPSHGFNFGMKIISGKAD